MNCPVCKSEKDFYYVSYSEIMWGTVEQHGSCERCGFFIEQAYSPSVSGIRDIRRGFRDYKGIYHAKNLRKHKRIRRVYNIKGIKINPIGCWMF